jgi:hypothetical protein
MGPIHFRFQRRPNCIPEPLHITWQASQEDIINMHIHEDILVEVLVSHHCICELGKRFEFCAFTNLCSMLVPLESSVELTW